MDINKYIQVGQTCDIVQAIPQSVVGDSVSISILRLSDGYTWNFSTLAFTLPETSGVMTFISGALWKQEFTPPTADLYIVTINDSTLDVSYYQYLHASGAVAQSGLTGTELTTLASLKEYLEITGTGNDTLLQNIITRISAEIERECDRSFTSAERTEYYCGDDSRELMVDNYPVTAVASIYIDGNQDWSADNQIDADDIIISNRFPGVIQVKNTVFSNSNDIENIKITYTAGYTTIPADLQHGCNIRCALAYIRLKGLKDNFEELGFNLVNMNKESGNIIDRFKRVR